MAIPKGYVEGSLQLIGNFGFKRSDQNSLSISRPPGPTFFQPRKIRPVGQQVAL